MGFLGAVVGGTVGLGVGAVVLAFGLPAIAGVGTIGPAVGGLFAGFQTANGAVAAGSAAATIQSAAMGGAGTVVLAKVGAVAGAAVGAVAGKMGAIAAVGKAGAAIG